MGSWQRLYRAQVHSAMDRMLKKLMLRPKVWPQQQCQSGVWMRLRIGETCFAIKVPEYAGGRGIWLRHLQFWHWLRLEQAVAWLG